MADCARCGESNPSHARFCLACGSALAPAPAAREGRRLVSVVFSDVIGSTALGERTDPESVRRIMSRYFSAMRTVVERHGGVVEKFIGDAVVGLFGVPELHEDDALRAVRAASEMGPALETLNADLVRSWGARLQIRTGVNTGEVVTGDDDLESALVTGDAVNVAARLQEAAAPGQVLLGRETYRLVRDHVEAEPLEPLTLKGKAEPVEAFALTGLATTHGVTRRLQSPLIGRQRELLLLRQAFEGAERSRSCHLFTLVGQPGVGKSRLAKEFLAGLDGEVTTLTGRCLSYGDGITFYPVRGIVSEAARITPECTPIEVLAKIAGLLEGEADQVEIARHVAGLVGVVEDRAGAEQSFWAVRKLLETMARKKPLVILIEDIHWAEPNFLELIDHISTLSRDAPILLLCLARPELIDDHPTWGGGKLNATSLLLEPLTHEEAHALISKLVGEAELPGVATDRMADAAEGNPLFLEEMFSMLIDDGLLERENGSWRATADLSEISVPPSIRALLAARLDRLSHEERRVLAPAAVGGRVFPEEAVAELLPVDFRDEVRAHLTSLVQKELLRPDEGSFAGGALFRFRHSLIRDAAYHELPKETRAQLHEQFADWLEHASGDRAREYEEMVGYHLEQAFRYRQELGAAERELKPLGSKAAAHLAGAGRRALAGGDMQAAVSLLSRGIMLFGDDAEGIALLPDFAAALRETGELKRAEATLDEAIAHASTHGDLSLEAHARAERAALRLQIDPTTGIEEATDEARRAIPLFERAGDMSGLAKAWQLIAEGAWEKCLYKDVDAALKQALKHATEAGDKRQSAAIRAFLALSASLGPTPVSEGIRVCEEFLAESSDDRRVQSACYRSIARFYAMQGRFDEAGALFDRGMGILEDLGLKFLVATGCQIAYTIYMLADDPETAAKYLRSGYHSLDQMGEKYYLSTTAGMLAQTLCALGRYEEASEFSHIGEEAASPQDAISQILWRSARAKVLARQSAFTEAETLAREAVQLALGTDFPNALGDAQVDLSEVLRLNERIDEAVILLQEALANYEAKENVTSADKARVLLKRTQE